MKKIYQKKLNIVLENHVKWLCDNSKGEQANLSNLDLSNLDFSGADLSYANLSCANLSYANLFSTDLSNTNLSNANLFSADLTGANLTNVDLTNANLKSANLYKADLSNANLTNLANFNFMLYNTFTDKTYYQVTNIGSRKEITTYCVDDNWIFCGCWNDYKGGALEEFEEKVEEVYGKCGEEPNLKYYNEYKNAIDYFKLCKNRRGEVAKNQ